MLTYTTLKDRPREFLAATGLTHAEFMQLLPAFAAAYTACYPLDKTWHGKVRQRQVGGGATGLLAQMEAKLNYSHLKWEFVWEPLEAVRVISYLSNRSSKRLSSFS